MLPCQESNTVVSGELGINFAHIHADHQTVRQPDYVRLASLISHRLCFAFNTVVLRFQHLGGELVSISYLVCIPM